MTELSREILRDWQIRKTKAQKPADSAQTGDQAEIFIFMMLMLTAMAVMIVMVAFSRRRRRSN